MSTFKPADSADSSAYPAAVGNLQSLPAPSQSVPPSSVAYLGPPGTFTEQALLTQSDLAKAEHRESISTDQALFAAEDGAVDAAFVAIENSIEGAVTVTIDMLAFSTGLFIQREVIMPIQLHLLAVPGAKLENITEVLSFPIALGQCRKFLQQHLPGAEQISTSSTAEAAQTVADANDPTKAAVGTQRAGEIRGLARLAENIQDNQNNQTCFVQVAKGKVPLPTGNDRTFLVVFQRENKPGSLLGILEEFSQRSIDLSKLVSRPMKQTLGEYCFVIECQGHIGDAHVAECLAEIDAKHGEVKFLGSYPEAEVVAL